MMHNETTIYVALLDEGTAVWRPVRAVTEGEGTYQIISINEHLDDEKWEFVTGDVVRCAQRILADEGMVLVAVEKVLKAPS